MAGWRSAQAVKCSSAADVEALGHERGHRPLAIKRLDDIAVAARMASALC